MLYLYHVNTFSYHEVTGPLLIGRTNGDLVFNDDGRMSGKHAQFTIEGEALFVEDLGSKNKTVINRSEIPAGQKLKLKNFTLLEVGSQQFILTDNKNLSIQQINDVMEHHISRPVVKLEKEMTKSNLKLQVPPPDKKDDEIAAKEAILLQLQKEIQVQDKIILDAKAKSTELKARAQALKDEVDKHKAEVQRIRTEMEQKKKKIINIKDL